MKHLTISLSNIKKTAAINRFAHIDLSYYGFQNLNEIVYIFKHELKRAGVGSSKEKANPHPVFISYKEFYGIDRYNAGDPKIGSVDIFDCIRYYLFTNRIKVISSEMDYRLREFMRVELID